MALIETTDDFFTSVTEQLNYGILEEHSIVKRLDNLYLTLTGINPHSQKSSIVIWDVFEKFIDENLIDNIQTLLNDPKYSVLPDSIKKQYPKNSFYQQGVILFIYWMLITKKRRLLSDWPFQRELLEPLANDLGVSTLDD